MLVALGHRWGDPVAGLAVTLFIGRVGFEVTRDVLRHLMDGVEDGDLEAARAALATIEDLPPGRVRGRWVGRGMLLEIEVPFRSDTCLGEVRAVQGTVRTAVGAAVPAAREIVVRIADPPD